MSPRTITQPPDLQELDVRRFRCELDEDSGVQRGALHANRGRCTPDSRVRSRRRERGVREPAGAGFATGD